MDIENIVKCESSEPRMIPTNIVSNYFLNNLLTSNIRTDIPTTDIMYFEIPLDSVDTHPNAHDYFCSVQRCFNSFTSINDEHQLNWSHSSKGARDYNPEFPEEIVGDRQAEDNFLVKLNSTISETDVTDVGFEEDDEFKGTYLILQFSVSVNSSVLSK